MLALHQEGTYRVEMLGKIPRTTSRKEREQKAPGQHDGSLQGHVLGKDTRKSLVSRFWVIGPFQPVDMSGQITPTTYGGFNYYGLFVDDATRKCYIAPMKTNGSAEMLVHLKLFAKMLETELGAKIKRIRTDGGSEYKRFVDAYLKEEGIQHEITAPYHPDQNGVVERANRTIMGRVRAIIEDAKFPREL